MKKFLVLFATLVVSGCATAPPPPSRDALITLVKGGCGFISACPAYTISMKPDGSYRYEGFRHVPLIGVREGQLPAGSWENAETAFMAAGWKNLEDPTTRDRWVSMHAGFALCADHQARAGRRRKSLQLQSRLRFKIGECAAWRPQRDPSDPHCNNSVGISLAGSVR